MNSYHMYLFAFLAVLISSATCFINHHPMKIKLSSTPLYSEPQIESVNPPTSSYKCPNAPKCSGMWREKGCDGTGKIQGGIATVPLLSWWPIKVFRPCPAYLEAGYVYRREGQTMDQVLFSEPSTKMKEKMEAIRLAELGRTAENVNDTTNEESKQQSQMEENLSEEEKFLKDRFGSQ